VRRLHNLARRGPSGCLDRASKEEAAAASASNARFATAATEADKFDCSLGRLAANGPQGRCAGAAAGVFGLTGAGDAGARVAFPVAREPFRG
jgi:hypothetical protein